MASCVVCSAEIRDDARFCPSCGAEQPKTMTEGDDPFIGQTIARNFKIEKLLGVGGMGKVYKARQLSLDKAVVIKVLHDHFRDDPQLVQRFQREARAASRLNHPNSIQVIDFGQDESGVLFMAIEFLNGTDLFTVLQKEGPFNEERISRVMVQVCSALGEAHEMNVIHRDLKPENIMIEDRRGRRDVVKVLDFGIAKIQDPDETPGQALTQAGMVCGTPEYMSPEQARGHQLDNRSDLYSLGVLVYQMTTGELPFQADTPIGIVTKHIIEQPVPPSEKYPHLAMSPDLEGVILRAMAKDPAERYQTALEMGAAFETLLRRFGELTGEMSLSAAADREASASAPVAAATEDAIAAAAPAPAVPAPAAPAQAVPAPESPPAPAAPPNLGAGASTEPAMVGGTQVGAPAVSPSSASLAPAAPVRRATVTAPTPTGLRPVVAAESSGGRAQWAAAAALVVLLLGAAGVFAFKDVIFPPTTATGDPSGTPVVDPKDPAAATEVTAQGTKPNDAATTANGNDQPTTTDPVAGNKGEAKPENGDAATAANTKDDGDPSAAKPAGDEAGHASAAKRDGDKGEAPMAENGRDEGEATKSSTKGETSGRSRDKGTKKSTAADSGSGRKRPSTDASSSSGSASRRAKAKALVGKASKVLISDPTSAYDMLKAAMRTDPSYPEPRKIIAFYWRQKGNTDASCAAMKDYIKLKGSSLSSGVRRSLLKQAKCPGS